MFNEFECLEIQFEENEVKLVNLIDMFLNCMGLFKELFGVL